MNNALIISWKQLLQFSIALFFFLFCLVCCLVVRNVSQSEMTIFLSLSAAAVWRPCTWRGEGCPPYVHAQFCTNSSNLFKSLYISQTITTALKSNPKFMCNMPKVAPILVTYFADTEFWAEFHLMKIGMYALQTHI